MGFNASGGRSPFRAGQDAGVAAVLGPTNTGKTHYAIERMLSFQSGMIGLPLRLLAREVYNRVAQKVGAQNVALITGEEKIKPRAPFYWVATVEAMPRDVEVDFLAIDEIQICADLDRGHIFTDRLLRWRGRQETLLLGAATMAPVLAALAPGAPVISRPRLSKLSYAGERKISRLPPRSAVVAFSAEEVYAIAEWIKRQRGGAAVVIGALSPRTRNAQIELYQNGEVDYIVATDAIGMGLNLDVGHIAFAADAKFDGARHRRLTPAEFGQIAGRAGRHLQDGTFGTTARCPPLDEELIQQIEDHRFDPLKVLQWRSHDLDFASPEALIASLDRAPIHENLTRARPADDQLALEAAARDETVRRSAKTRADVQRLWEACQIPDYRKTSPAAHAELVTTVFGFIVRAGRIPDDWMARQIAAADRTDGDISTLANRLAQVRTSSFIANRSGWLNNSEHWQSAARRVEDSISDALHDRLTMRFVDRRTSVLMRRLRENAMLEAEITASGDVMVEGQHVGSLQGFRFTPDPAAAGEAAKALTAAGQKALAGEFSARATRVFDAVDDAFVLANDGVIRWLGEPVGKIAAGGSILAPGVRVVADDQLAGADLDKVTQRLGLWLAQHVKKLLGPLAALEAGEGLEGVARGVAFQIAEELGVLERSRVARDLKTLSQEDRGALRKLGVRFGAYHLYLPQLLKPAPRTLAALLWALKHGGGESVKGLDEVPHLAASGRTSFAADHEVAKGFYRAAGFRVCGERVVRVDILERLADLIRPAVAYRPGTTAGDPPAGAADGEGFVVTVAMTSLTGCAGEAFASILRSLGYVSQQRPGPAITAALVPAAPTTPVTPSKPAEDPEISAEAATTSEGESAPDASAGASDEIAASLAEDPAEAPLASPPSAEPTTNAADESLEAKTEAPAESTGLAEPETSLGAPADGAAETQADAEDSSEATEPGSAPAAEAGPPLLEIWSPQRRPHHAPRAGAGPNRRHSRPQGNEPSAANQPSGDSADRSGEKRRERAPGGPQRPRSERFNQAAPGRGDRGPRDEDRKSTRPANFAPPKRERQPDPDSPFAKLAALKAELERKGKS